MTSLQTGLYNNHSLVSRSLKAAILRIALVAISAGAVSYFVNRHSIEQAAREQLLLSTQQTLQRESLPFREIQQLQRNFLQEFQQTLADAQQYQQLVTDFDKLFYRHEDGSYTQRPGLFEGQPLADGRRFANMSATYAPDIPPDADTKARFTLSYLLSYKYGSSVKGRLFNFYGVVPEKGFPIYQDADIAKVFTYSGPEALKLESYEFYARGFAATTSDSIFTRMYFDFSNNAWMTTIATPDQPDANGQHHILACVDVLLDELMKRTAQPTIKGTYSTIFQADEAGTLIFHPTYTEAIQNSEGAASITSLHLQTLMPVLAASHQLQPGQVTLVESAGEIVALGQIPDTPWVLSVHYPEQLARPAILQNLIIVIALGLITLLVEIFIIRSILLKQVAVPLRHLAQAMRAMGSSANKVESERLPNQTDDEIGALAKEFINMAKRVRDSHQQLETKVQQRTAELEAANRQLQAISTTDELTGLANRRLFDEVLERECARAQRESSDLALLMIDVDWFKKYNDHYGHQAGDACLRRVAQVLSLHCRRAGDLLARYGGEEFVLISPATDLLQAGKYAESLAQAIASELLPHHASPFGHVTVSIGAAAIRPVGSASEEMLIMEADQAMYRAKHNGRNGVAIGKKIA
ncbi:diguanylate cyclase [Pokkaliibacter plantistimulans]|uniref:diguanylate cyclase n=1 Tax=Pokkaliibacter plantistimulans TaxID=1635171 RepID=A0ABX5M2D3_9GAMM|nr:GGDEF domain-containing protein [Pokkaliibacter plantistimulans]PXF33072.1 diguanylate cyclase [Pokkaliibacter plantistimulans]